MPRKNIQNVLEETWKHVNLYINDFYPYILIRQPNDKEPHFLLDEFHVYCEVINQCLEL